MTGQTLQRITLAATLLVSTATNVAQAAPNNNRYVASAPIQVTPGGHDYFAHQTPGNAVPPQTQRLHIQDHTKAAPKPSPRVLGAGAMAQGSTRTPVVAWFESYDTAVAMLRPSKIDRAILTQSFHQEAERVQRWTTTANSVSKNYKRLAQQLKSTPVPPGCPDIEQYRNLSAEWYLDTAAIYDDLTRPRQPAQTMEELEAQLDDIKTRAEGQKQQAKDLYAMNMDLRKTYRVHASREDDALTKYVRGQ